MRWIIELFEMSMLAVKKVAMNQKKNIVYCIYSDQKKNDEIAKQTIPSKQSSKPASKPSNKYFLANKKKNSSFNVDQSIINHSKANILSFYFTQLISAKIHRNSATFEISALYMHKCFSSTLSIHFGSEIIKNHDLNLCDYPPFIWNYLMKEE